LWEINSAWKLRRHIPLGGNGIIYPNFSHPDDILRLRLKEEMEVLNIGQMNKTITSRTDKIYLNVDSISHHEFMNELRTRMRT